MLVIFTDTILSFNVGLFSTTRNQRLLVLLLGNAKSEDKPGKARHE